MAVASRSPSEKSSQVPTDDNSHNSEEGHNDKTLSTAEAGDAEKQEAVATAPNEAKWVSGLKLWIIMTGVTLVCFLMLLDISILSTATPKITSDFNSLQDVGWYGAAYQLASATLQPLTGKFYTNFDTKWTFFVFFLLFELGSLLCGVAVTSNMLIVGRAVAGMGASGLQNGAFTIIAGCVPMPKRPALFGVMLGVAQLGLVGGPLIGGVLTQFVTWRWCFYINLPIGGLVAALLGFTRIPEQIRKPRPSTVLRDLHNKLDLVGFTIFAPAMILFLLAVQFGGNQYQWNSAMVIGLFCGAGGTTLIWFAWDYYKKDAAMIPLSMLRPRCVWSSCLTMAFLAAAMFTTSYYLPIYFQGVRGKSPAISGVYLLPSILSQLTAAVLSGKAVGHFGYYLPWSVISAALTAVGYGLTATLDPHTSTGKWIGYQILFGAGRGSGLQMPMVAVQATVAPAQIPTAMSLLAFSQTFAGALFLSFADTTFTNSLQTLLKQDAPGVDVEAVVGAGAYGIRQAVPKATLRNVLQAYADSIDRVFYMCAGLAGGCFVLAWAMGWVDIRKEPETKVTAPIESRKECTRHRH